MKHSELITQVSIDAGIDHRQVETVLRAYVKTVLDTVRRGDMLTHRGFGLYYAGKFTARDGRNPRTGQIVHMRARKKLRLRVAAIAEAEIN